MNLKCQLPNASIYNELSTPGSLSPVAPLIHTLKYYLLLTEATKTESYVEAPGSDCKISKTNRLYLLKGYLGPWPGALLPRGFWETRKKKAVGAV